MRLPWLPGAPLWLPPITVWVAPAGVGSGDAVRINGAIDKLARANRSRRPQYDFAIRGGAVRSSDLDSSSSTWSIAGSIRAPGNVLLGTTNKAEIAKQGNLQVRVPP